VEILEPSFGVSISDLGRFSLVPLLAEQVLGAPGQALGRTHFTSETKSGLVSRGWEKLAS